jgi:hypothetical protein
MQPEGNLQVIKFYHEDQWMHTTYCNSSFALLVRCFIYIEMGNFQNLAGAQGGALRYLESKVANSEW